MYYVYLLKSGRDGKLYVGLTSDLRQRLRQHEEGLTSSTSYRRPLRLICYEVYLDRLDAIRREKFLKSGRGREVMKKQLESYLGEVAEWPKAAPC